MKTITRADVTEVLYEEVGLSRKDSSDIVDMFIVEIRTELSVKRAVKLSSFGTFNLRHKKKRIGRNPQTGVEADISERTVIVFKPSQALRTALNKKFKKN